MPAYVTDLKVGSQYELVNVRVAQGLPNTPPIFILQEMFECRGQMICYGTKPTHQQEIFIRGFESIPSSPACFVVLPHALIETVVKLTQKLSGMPLILRSPNSKLETPIVNWGRNVRGLWHTRGSAPTPKNEMLRRARYAIDLYMTGFN